MLALLILLAGGVLAGATVAGSELSDRRASRRAAEDELAQAAAAEAAADQTQRRSALRERIANFGVGAFMQSLLLQLPWSLRFDALDRQETLARSDVERAGNHVDAREERIAAGRLMRSVALTLGALLLWAVAATVAWYLDATLLYALHGSWSLAIVLALVIFAFNEMFGLAFFSALRVHPIPLISDQRGRHRFAIAIFAMAVLGAFILGVLAPLAQTRAERTVGNEVRAAVNAVEVAEDAGDPDAAEQARAARDAAERRLESARTTDLQLATLAAVTVFLLSWAPFHAVEVIGAERAQRGKLKAEAALERVEPDRQTLSVEFRSHVAELLDDLGLDVDEVRTFQQGGAPAGRAGDEGGGPGRGTWHQPDPDDDPPAPDSGPPPPPPAPPIDDPFDLFTTRSTT